MEITEKKYLEALYICQKYVEQEELKFNKLIKVKTLLKVWFDNLEVKSSTRLKNVLFHSRNYENGQKFKYLEDITKKKFLYIENSGIGTWNELQKLIEESKV